MPDTFTITPKENVDRFSVFVRLPGPKGDPGDSATVEIGDVTTGDAGSEATVENVGTDSAVILNFSIPKGDEGIQGEPGNDSTVPGPQGEDGKSAYELAIENGFVGTEEEWLASLVGEDGADSTVPGADGDSAYQVAVNNGFVGTEAEWLASLVGADGIDGADSTVPGPAGMDGLNADMTRTSNDSLTAGITPQTLTYVASLNLGWTVGTRLRFASASFYFEGKATAVSSTSTTIDTDISSVIGAFSDSPWIISVAGDPGTNGVDGDDGPNNVTTETATNLTGLLKGDGVNVSAVLLTALDFSAIPSSPGTAGTLWNNGGSLCIA